MANGAFTLPAVEFAEGEAAQYDLSQHFGAEVSPASVTDIELVSGSLPSGVTINVGTESIDYDGEGAAAATGFQLLVTTAGGTFLSSSCSCSVLSQGSGSDPEAEALLTLGDATVLEGDAGYRYAVFELSRGADGEADVVYDWATEDGTGTAGADYIAASGSGTISASETVEIRVRVLGDTSSEGNQAFTLRVSNIQFA